MKHPIPVRIPEVERDELRAEAREEGLTISAVIRRLIIRHCAARKSRKPTRVKVA